MPPSPSFPSGSRGKWMKKRRDSQIGRRNNYSINRHDDDDEDEDLAAAETDEMERDNDDSEDLLPTPNSSLQETELLLDDKLPVSEFPRVVKRAVTRPHSSVLDVVAMERANRYGETKGLPGNPLILENVSYGQLQALSAMPVDNPALLDQERAEAGNAAYVITPPPIMEGRGVVKRFGSRVHAVPMHSDWFSPATVHRLERQVVPHFFSGKLPDCTPEKYMEIRNFVVAKYMENPEKRVTISDCQGLVDGVSNEDLTRIVRFLDHWGIINYCAPSPNCEPWNSSSYLREDANGEIHVPSAALKPIDSLIKIDKPKCRLKVADVYSALSCHDDNDSLCDLDNRIREHLAENHCSSCSRSVPSTYYQSQKVVDVLLCSDCFHEGKYVAGHSSIDFLRVDTKDYGELDCENWTDQETLLLLEAIELYNENWNEITEHVGSKSKAQCIIHFLRLSVEGGILEDVDVPGVPLSSNSSHGEDNKKSRSNMNGNVAGSSSQDNKEMHDRLPFANSGNSVMALVAFLASAIGPRVAASCAHASLAALSEDSAASSGSIFQMEGSVNINRTNVEVTHGRNDGTYRELQNSVMQKDENKTETGLTLLSAERVKVAAKVGLAAAATKAKLFADHEEREIQRLSANIINHQLKRLELKLKQFAEVETFLMKECEQVERTRQRFVAERARMLGVQFGPAGSVSSPASLPGVIPPTTVNNNSTNNRQNMISPPPSQPSVSGYSNNQSLHPHMSYMPRQPIFGLGQRLSLPVNQQPPSTTSSNAMFNGPSNAQASLSHPMMRTVSGSSSGLV